MGKSPQQICGTLILLYRVSACLYQTVIGYGKFFQSVVYGTAIRNRTNGNRRVGDGTEGKQQRIIVDCGIFRGLVGSTVYGIAGILCLRRNLIETEDFYQSGLRTFLLCGIRKEKELLP